MNEQRQQIMEAYRSMQVESEHRWSHPEFDKILEDGRFVYEDAYEEFSSIYFVNDHYEMETEQDGEVYTINEIVEDEKAKTITLKTVEYFDGDSKSHYEKTLSENEPLNIKIFERTQVYST